MTEESVEAALNRLNEAFPEGTGTTEERAQLCLRMKNAVAEVNTTNQAKIDKLEAKVRRLIATRDALVAIRHSLEDENRNVFNNDYQNLLNDENRNALNAFNINENNNALNNNESNPANPPNNDDEKDFDMRGDLFKKSSHRYLFMDTITRRDNTSYEVSWNDTILALSVIALQIFGYCFVANLLFKKHAQERNSRTRPPPDIDPALVSVMIPTTGFVLLSFLLPDLLELCILLKCKGRKTTLAGLLILFKSVVALIVSALVGVCVPVIGMREAFLLYAGLIFAHKVDERIGTLQDILKKVQEKYAFLYPLFGSILVPIVLTFLPRIV